MKIELENVFNGVDCIIDAVRKGEKNIDVCICMDYAEEWASIIAKNIQRRTNCIIAIVVDEFPRDIGNIRFIEGALSMRGVASDVIIFATSNISDEERIIHGNSVRRSLLGVRINLIPYGKKS